MMKMLLGWLRIILKKNKILFYLLVLFSIVYSQTEVDTLIEEVYAGNLEKARESMARLRNEFPDDPSLLFLDAMLDENVDQSIKKFKKIQDFYKDSEYADDAIMKIAEYYYTKGLYEQSSNWLKKINLYYPNSEHVNRSLNMHVRTLILSGKEDTAKQYLDVFKKRYKDISFDGHIEDVINEYTSKIEEKEENEIIKIVKNLKKTISSKKDKQNNKNHFSIQVGAYSDEKNAEAVRDELIDWKFNSSRIDIIHLRTKNKNLYAVRVGYFRSKESARITKKKVELRTGYNTIVVDTNEY